MPSQRTHYSVNMSAPQSIGKSSAVENSSAEVIFARSVVENNPTSAYTIIIFINPTFTYIITFLHHHEGRLGLV